MSKHRSHTITRIRLVALCALAAMAAMAPVAGADTANPVFTCRASAGYLELLGIPPAGPLPRVEPVSANAAEPTTTNPDGDRAQCASDRGGLPSVVLPPGANPGLQLTLQAPFAETTIAPELGAARDQTATSSAATALDPVDLDLGPGQLVISAEALNATPRRRASAARRS